MSSFNILSNLLVRTRVMMLGGLSIVAIAVLGSAYWVSDVETNTAFISERGYSQLATRAEAIQVSALQLRRREKDFLLRSDLKYATKYEKDHETMTRLLGELRGMAVAAPLIRDIDALASGARTHRDQFRKVVALKEKLGLTEKAGLQGALRNAVHDAETKLKEGKVDSLTVKMLMMRRHEKDFMLRGTEKYIGRIDKRRKEFNALLASAAVSQSFRENVSANMDTYQKRFRDFAKTALVLKKETKQLSAIFGAMGPSFDALGKAAIEGKAASGLQLESTRASAKFAIAGVGIVVIVLALMLIVLIGRSISVPLVRLADVMRVLAGGKTDVDVPSADSRDEIGDMARAVLVFKDNSAENQRLVAEREESERRNAEERRTTMLQLADRFESQVQSVVDAVASSATEMQATAQQMTGSAEESSTLSTAIASASGQASANVQTVAAAAEELSTSISEISRQVDQSTKVANSAVDEANTSTERFQALATAADRIGEVVSLIQGVAEQTNLLALNATIEAARAGEAGKGFAVVASEVKNLASQTAKATEEISIQVAGVQEESKQAVTSIERIGDVIDEMNNISTGIASAMEEQSVSTQEITRNVQEAARGTQEVSNNIEGLSTAAGETGAASNQVLNSSSELSKQFEMLRGEVDKFLAEVRAA